VTLKSWEVNDKGVTELTKQEGVAALLRQLSQQGVEVARSLAPVFTGNYRDSIVAIEPAVNEDGVLQGGFGSDSSLWHFVEFGSPWSDPHRVLANAAIAVTGGNITE
jgi:hypothetical protein